jgi:replication factor C subunit 2/4
LNFLSYSAFALLRIMEPLGSRCAKFRFEPIGETAALARLSYIATSEGFPVQQEALSFLISYSDGDLRKAINLMQSAHRFLSSAQQANAILTLSFAHHLTGYIADAEIFQFYESVTLSLEVAPQECAKISRKGYSVTQFLSQLHAHTMNHPDLTSIQKSLLALRFASYEKRLLDGADAELQLLSLAADLSEYSTRAKKILLL